MNSSTKINFLKPSGNYNVGTVRFDFEDDNRYEVVKGHENEKRLLSTQVWYPCNLDKTYEKAPWMMKPKEMLEHVNRVMSLPEILIKDLSEAETSSYLNAPLQLGVDRYPLIVYSHGYASFLGQNTLLMEELASHGYIVCSIAHTYECFATTRVDGTVVGGDLNRVEIVLKGTETKHYGEVLRKMSSDTTANKEWDFYVEHALHNDIQQVWVQDQKFIIDQLMRLNDDNNSMFYKRINTDSIGAFGHSFGGSTSIHTALGDERVGAGINMDGTSFGNVTDYKYDTPIMFINNYGKVSEGIFTGHLRNKSLYEKSNVDAYHITINGSKHLNFSEVGYGSSRLKDMGVLGSIDNTKMQEILRFYILEFFDVYLKGKISKKIYLSDKRFDEVYMNSK